MTVGGYVLTEEGDFEIACFGKLFEFLVDLFSTSRFFATTDIGDYAISAVVVTAVDNRDPGAEIALANFRLPASTRAGLASTATTRNPFLR